MIDEECEIPDHKSSKTYSCPLTRPNVYGIKSEANLRFDCDGPKFFKYSLLKHFEYYHRMLPECAVRLRDAILDGQSDQTKLFSDNEIIFVTNQKFFLAF